MTGRLRPRVRSPTFDGRGSAVSIVAFGGLLLLYLLTAPTNHALSVDAYWLAQIIAVEPITEVEQPRLFLWIAAMQALHAIAAAAVADPDPFSWWEPRTQSRRRWR